MERLRIAWARLVGLVTRSSRDARLAAEIAGHLQALEDEHRRRGLPPDEARLAARRDFGGVDRVTEAHRDQAGLPWLDAVGRDLRVSIRRVRSEPWFSASVVAALSVGIGGAASVAAAVTAISWASPPFRDPARVMAIATVDATGGRAAVSWPDYQTWRDDTRAFERLSAFGGGFFTIAAPGHAVARVQGAYVTANMFAMLGVSPMRGRDFTADDDRAGATPVALIGTDLWAATFGRAEDIVGRSIDVDGLQAEIVGVMPPGFSFPLAGDVWMPMVHRPGLATAGRDRRSTEVMGRLQPGVTRQAALEEITRLADREAAVEPPSEHRVTWRPTMVPFAERWLGRSTDPAPLALLAAAAMVLAIGCATAGTLLFARSTVRADEIAMRAALGASRARLIQQLLIECAVYAAIAAAVGLAITWIALRAFAVNIEGAGLPPWVRFVIDARVLAIGAVAFVVAVVGGGLAPAWRLAGAGTVVATAIGRTTAPRATQRWIRALLAVEVALTLVMLSSAAQLLTATLALWRADRVVDTAGGVTARVGLSGPDYARPDQRASLYGRYLTRLQERRELRGVSVVSMPPFGNTPLRRIALERTPEQPVQARHLAVDHGYVATLGLSPLQGRGFDEADGRPGREVAMVNARFAAQYFPAGNAVGRRIRVADSPTGDPAGAWLSIVGVLPSIRQGAAPDAEPVVYVPLVVEPPATAFVIARAAENVLVADILRDELRALDPGLPIYAWQTLERWSEISRWTQRTIGGIVAVLAVLALTLSALGIYAVTSYAVGRRRKEAGIRLAVGATPAHLTRLFVRGALWPAALGVGAGIAGAMALSGALRSLTPEAGSSGAVVALTAVAVGVVAVVAAILPARVVASDAPLHALRCD